MTNTRFKDLPEDKKQKLINLKNISNIGEVKTLDKEKIKTHSDILLKINSLETNSIKEDLSRITNYLQNVEKADAEVIMKNLEDKLKEMERNIELYEHAINEPVFVDELKEVYEMLSGKFLQLKCRKGVGQ